MNSEDTPVLDLHWLKRGSIASPFIVVLVIFIGGGGHGFLLPYALLYPSLAVLGNLVSQDLNYEFYLIIIMLLQFPFFGFILDLSKYYFKKVQYGLSLILFFHLMFLLYLAKNHQDFF